MNNPPKARARTATHPVDGEFLKRLQYAKWSNPALAKRAGVSVKTIERARDGKPIRLDFIDCIAQALGVGVEKLLLVEKPIRIRVEPTGERIKVPVNPEKRVTVSITLGISIEDFHHAEKVVSFSLNLKNYINASDVVEIIEVKDGSTLVTAEMSTQDVLRLMAGIMDGKLADLKVQRVGLADYSWLMRMIVSLKLLGTPVEPDAQTWSDMLNANMMEGVFEE